MSKWRLLLAGLYPVEFRDFFLGDMYCSLTYFMGVSIHDQDFSTFANHWIEHRTLFLLICTPLE